jgi:protein-arginine kinase activator protein McsA
MRKKPDIPCKNCSKLFHARRKQSLFCCRECSIIWNTEHGVFKKTEEQRTKISIATQGRVPHNKGKHNSAKQIAKFKESIKDTWTPEKRAIHSLKHKKIWADSHKSS